MPDQNKLSVIKSLIIKNSQKWAEFDTMYDWFEYPKVLDDVGMIDHQPGFLASGTSLSSHKIHNARAIKVQVSVPKVIFLPAAEFSGW